jgi:hypothetical protein
MRVALDATPLVLSSGGLRRYVEELGLAFALEFPRDEVTLISDQAFHISAQPAQRRRSTQPPGAKMVARRRRAGDKKTQRRYLSWDKL